MDLTGLALRAAAARPYVLLATAPGGTAARLAAERLVRLWDWPPADTPAQADLLLVAGPDCPPLRAAVDRLWHDLPAPRARVHAPDADDVEAALRAGQARLRSRAGWRERFDAPAEGGDGDDGGALEDGAEGAREDEGGGQALPNGARGKGRGGGRQGHGARHEGRDGGPGAGTGGGSRDAHGGHGEHGGGAGHQGHGGGAGHHGHGGGAGHHGHGGGAGHHGHGGGAGELPGGLPMAEPGEDRDGLTLDRLHVPLGPFLTDWPAGLTIRLTMQGDVVQEAEVAEPVLSGTGAAFWVQPWLRAAAGEPVPRGEAARRRAAAHLDSVARFLSVAGWPAEAVAARRLRDDLLEGASGAAVAPRLTRFARRVGGSRTLAWLTRGIGRLDAGQARAAGVSGPAARAGGDVTDRYRQWLADIRRDVGRLADAAPLGPGADESPRGLWRDDAPPSAALVALLPGLLTGAELAAARLVVASLDPDLDEPAAARRDAGVHG
ncbi:hypothetical protein [Streptomyces sp. NPDC006012]|uniref:hypothetical protein n=1 Tax=Streptomyces sp. NPDC006012 TaxID=3364739 RepID=UPI0036BCD502